MTKHAEELAKLGWQYFECPACGSEGARAFPKPEQEPVLQDIEQYRLQMAGISTAAIGYWKEGDGIHPDYDTLALRDVAKLYEKYDELYKAQDVSHGIIAGALFDFMGWLTSRPKRIMLSSADDASPAVDAIKDFAKMRGLSLDDARVQDWQEALAEQPAQDDPDLQDKDPELVEQPAQHEPFTHYRHYDNGLQDWADEKTIPLYTSPPAQRTWVGLTDEEIETKWFTDLDEACEALQKVENHIANSGKMINPPAQQEPLRVAKVGQRVHGPELLPASVWRYQLKRVAWWFVLGILGMLWLALLMACVSYSS